MLQFLAHILAIAAGRALSSLLAMLVLSTEIGQKCYAKWRAKTRLKIADFMDEEAG